MLTAKEKAFRAALKDGLRIQHRFKAEPLLAKTGKGYMKSEGVATLAKIKAGIAKTQAKRGRLSPP